MFAEAEEPKGQPDKPTKEWATMRLSILAHLGFSEIPINYRQPSLAPGKQPLSNLKFLLNSTHGATIGLNILKSFMHEFYAGFDEKVDELIMFGALPPDEIRTKPLGDSL